MSVVNAGLMLSAPSGYTIDRSLRFRASASAYLNRTPASAGNRKTWTWSGWVKRGSLSTAYNQYLFSAVPSASVRDAIIFNTSSGLSVFANDASSAWLVTNQVFRDVSAWYHILVSVDTTQATASNRIKVYINGLQVTSFSTSTYPSQNYNWAISNTVRHTIGDDSANAPTSLYHFDGYITEVNFIDGQALDPTDFGEYNDDTGVWQAKKYVGTYGTNGFYLNFRDNSSTTTLGEDSSGNGNDWTLNNFSLTSGSTYDSMTDVPTLTSETQGNYATLNPLDNKATISDGNLKITYASASWKGARATISIPKTGKWKWEVTPTQMVYGFLAVAMPSANVDSGGYTATYVYSWYLDSGEVRYSNSNVATGKTVSAGDVCEVRVDDGEVSFYKNNVLQHTFTQLLTDISDDYFPACWIQSGAIHQYNFGQRPFVYTPTGFKALNTYNLPDSTVADGSDYFNTVLYTGNGGTQTITGVGFNPDWVWIKNRTNATANHNLVDVLRGNEQALQTNTTNAESNQTGNGTSLTTDGFILTTPANGNPAINGTSNPLVAWNWKANGSGVSNTDGSITSTVSANTTAGFSIVTYTGTGSAATVGHGLGVAPSMVIVKNRPFGGSWGVYHTSIGATNRLLLNGTNASTADSGFWNNTASTSTVFSIGSDGAVNRSGDSNVAYCFAEVKGFSKMGSYTGNGSADGPFVFCGFRPSFIFWKNASTTSDWQMKDSSRSTYNVTNANLYANLANAENSAGDVDFLSNGFKLRSAGTDVNGSGNTIIYVAFAENPFKNSLAR